MKMAYALAGVVLLVAAVGRVVSIASLGIAAIGMLLTRRTTTGRREPQRPRG